MGQTETYFDPNTSRIVNFSVTLAEIDAAPTEEKRIELIKRRLAEENQACMSSGSSYWAISVPFDSSGCSGFTTAFTDNLIWDTMHDAPRPTLKQRLFYFDSIDHDFCGYVDIETQCQSITRHDNGDHVHRCINREAGCFEITLNILGYEVHPMPDYRHPDSLNLFKYCKADRHSITAVYNCNRFMSGRLTACDGFFSYVPSLLAGTDGLIPASVLERLSQSQTVVSAASIEHMIQSK